MKIEVFRYNSDEDHTNSIILINGRFQCYGIEDEYRAVKVKHETRIPDGTYKVTFRTEGGFHEKYKAKFGGWHKGMLWVREVPGFEYILIHIGNDDDDTSGCLVLGDSNARGDNFIPNSKNSYMALYPKVKNALLRGEEVEIIYKTLDKYK